MQLQNNLPCNFVRFLQNNNPTDTAIITVFGAVLGWIFQDTIKSVAAFFYLRANGLLQIGDLIAVPANLSLKF